MRAPDIDNGMESRAARRMILRSLRRIYDSLRTAAIRKLRWKYGSSAAYWEERTRRMGTRAVFNRRHPPDATEKAAADLRALLVPLLDQCLDGRERTLLDFGCGYGRLTSHFGSLIDGIAIGVDPVPALLDHAVAQDRTEFRLMRDGRIPMPDASADVIAIVQVLCNITKARELATTIAELRRVLAPGGLVFLVDNTTSHRKSPHHVRLRSEGDYINLFQFTKMRRVGGYDDAGESFSVLAGRRR